MTLTDQRAEPPSRMELQLCPEDYEGLFENSPLPTVIYDLDTLGVVKVNRRFCEIYGYSPKQALELTTHEIRAPKDQLRFSDDLKQLCQNGVLDLSAIRHRKSDGTIFTVEVSSQLLRRREKCLVVATMSDISEKVEFENRLLNNNRRYEQASLATREIIYDWDLETNQIHWSDSLMDQLGYPSGEARFDIRKWTSAVHPEDRELFVNELDLLISSGDPLPYWHREYRMRCANGTLVHVSDRALVIRAENGQGLRIIGAIEDISTRKTVELELENAFRQLQDSTAKYEDLFAKAPAFVAYLSGRDHVFQMANPEYLRLVGRQMLGGRPIREVLPELSRQGCVKQLDQVFRTGETICGKEEAMKFQDPCSGTWRTAYVNIVYSPSRRQDGTIEGVCIFGVDVTDMVLARKRVELASSELKAIKENLEALINSTDDLIWSVNRDGILLSANEPFLRRVRELTGKSITEGDSLEMPQFGSRFLQKWKTHYDRAFKGERFSIQEDHEEARPRHSVFIFNPIHDENGTVTGVACYARDVTERAMQLKAIQEQNRQIKEIAWIQSHVIRAPLARLMGLCQLIEAGDSPEMSTGELIQHLQQSAHELDTVIGEISRKTESINL